MGNKETVASSASLALPRWFFSLHTSSNATPSEQHLLLRHRVDAISQDHEDRWYSGSNLRHGWLLHPVDGLLFPWCSSAALLPSSLTSTTIASASPPLLLHQLSPQSRYLRRPAGNFLASQRHLVWYLSSVRVRKESPQNGISISSTLSPPNAKRRRRGFRFKHREIDPSEPDLRP